MEKREITPDDLIENEVNDILYNSKLVDMEELENDNLLDK